VTGGGERLTRAYVVVHVAFALAFGLVVARTLASPEAIAQTDFTAFYTGWWLVLHGRGAELYDVAAQQAAQHALVGAHEFPSGLLAFLHPPHAALAGAPLGLVAEHAGERVAFWLWTAVNVALLARLARGVLRLAAPETKEGRLAVATAVLGAFPVFLTLREGQVALLLAVALLGFFEATRDERPRAVAAWALVLSLKPQFLPLPLALLVGLRQWRALAWVAAFGVVAGSTSAVALGPGIFARYFHGLGALQGHLGRGVPGAMLSLRGLLVRLFPAARASLALTISLGVLALDAVAFALSPRGRAKRPISFALAFAAALFLSPHLFIADLTLWAVPLALAAADLRGTPDLARFGRFALAWPLVLAATLAVDAWPRLFFESATGLALVALVWIARLERRLARS
jgi:hypothetical protein